MAGDAIAVVLFLLMTVSAVPDVQDLDAISLASRTLQSAAVFDGRVLAPVTAGRLLFRVRRVYKGWHRQNFEQHEEHPPRVMRLDHESDVRRLIYVSCASSANFRRLTVRQQDVTVSPVKENSRNIKVQSRTITVTNRYSSGKITIHGHGLDD